MGRAETHRAIPRFACLLALALIAVLAITARASAAAVQTIARANLDGTGIDRTFMSGPFECCLSGLAVDGSDIYWSESSQPLHGTPVFEIGRANLDGSNANPALIPNAVGPVAVDSSHIYWGGEGTPNGGVLFSIGRGNLDGSATNPQFIGGGGPGLAVTSSFIYWEDPFDGISRANIDGSAVVEPLFNPFSNAQVGEGGLAADGSHVYWADSLNGTIGRANLDGSAPTTIVTGIDFPVDIAVDGSHIYWATSPSSGNVPSAIGRANLDGSNPEPDFISAPLGAAPFTVGATHIYWADLATVDYGKTVFARIVSGHVSVKRPGKSGFTPLIGGEQLPVGSIIDATRGRVNLTSAKDKKGTKTETADFYGGAFKVLQPRQGKPITELDLAIGSGHARLAKVALRHKKSEDLWGNGHGNYVTKGKHGSATVRGTIWFTQDRSNGTFFKVTKDKVLVRDFTRHRTKVLHAGQHYLAPAR